MFDDRTRPAAPCGRPIGLRSTDDDGAVPAVDGCTLESVPVELARNIAALKAAFTDYQAGDVGRPARQALRETSERLGLVIDD